MSTTVDERVVSMRFDNKDFEKNVNTSMSTIEKLKQSLLFKGATNGFKDIDKAAKDVDMGHLEKGVESVRAKFSALEVMGITALANITNSALNAGKKIASALTIEPIKAGFSEYETQMNAVQTILANTSSKGTTLTQVNKALDELNTYADKTIYNFTEMTRNIGTFTAAGVDLDTSVSAIKGIANLAAVSGSSSQQASTAMYQLSQALASGTVKLMDWNSVVNAGMGGQVFQDSLKETAKLHGKNVDAMIKKEGSFRETLKDGWLTADILTETLAKFTGDLDAAALKKQGYTDEQIKEILELGEMANNAATKVKTLTQLWDTLKEAAQSGWSQSWRIIVGDFEESKAFFTEVSDTIGALIGESAEARNKLLSGGLSSGWKQFLEAGISDEEGFKESLKKVAKEAGTDLDELQKSLGKDASFEDTLAAGFKDGSLNADMFSKSVSDLANKMRGMSEEEMEAAGYTKEHLEQIEKLEAGLKDGSVSMEEFVDKMSKPSGRENLIDSLRNSFQAIMKIITPIKEAFNEIFPPATADQLYSLTEKIKSFSEKLIISDETATKLKDTFKGVFSVIKIGVDIFKDIAGGASKLLGAILPLGGGLLDVTGSLGDFLSGISEAVSELNIFETVFDGAASILGAVATGISSVLSSLAGGIDKCGGVIGIVKKMVDLVGQLFDKIQVATPGDSIFDTLFNLVNGGIFTAIGLWIAKTIKALSNFTENAGGFLEGITGILEGVGDALQAFTGSIKADTLKKIAIAIGILAASLWVLSTIKPGELTTALVGMAVLFKMLTSSLSSLDAAPKGVGKTALALIGLSTAILILSAALKIMSTMSWSEMGVGLISLTVGLQVLIRSIKALPEKDVNAAAKSLKKLASAILAYSVAMKILGSMSWQEMAVGLTSMVIGLGALVSALHLLPKDTSAKASSMITLASAMVVLGVALKIMGSMSWQELALGIGGMAIGLGVLVKALNSLPEDAAGKAGTVLLLASAMVVLGAALKIMGSMSWQEMAVGLGGVAVSLLAFTKALNALPKDSVGKAGTVLLLASAMLVLGVALKVISSISWEGLVKGIAAIATVLVILRVAAYALAPVSGVLLAIGGAVALVGIGCLAAGAGLVLLATGLTALAAAIVGSVGIILAGANELVGVFTTIILSLVNAIVTCIPAITNGVLLLLVSVIQGLAQYTPQLVDGLFDFLIGLINAIATRLPELIQAGVDLLMSFFQGVIDALGTIDPKVLVEGLAAVGLFAGIIVALSALVSFIPGAMVAVLGMGALVVELGLVLAAIGALAQIPGLKWLISEGGDFLQTIGTAIGQFFGGIVAGFAQGATSTLPQIGADLSAFMLNATPFMVGIKLLDQQALEGAKTLVGIILALTGAGIIDALTSWLTGGNTIADFGKQLAEFGPYIAKFAESVSGINTEAVTAAANAGKMLAEMADVIPSDLGNDNLIKFGEQLGPFGSNLTAFNDKVKGISAESVSGAANATKTLTEAVTSIPSDWGHNNLIKFGEQLNSFGPALSGFVTAVSGITADSINGVTSVISNIANIQFPTDAVSAFTTSLNTLALHGIDGFLNAFTSSQEKTKTAITGFISAVKSKIDSEKSEESTIYTSFKGLGSFLVDGFVKGIDNNTFKAEAKAKAMAKAAYDAAKKELDVNSPSKKFMSVGGSVVEGFVKGISKNLGDTKKSAVELGTTVLTATQECLGIHSPSLVFKDEVGRPIVQGIAEGIKKDMSAEEAAEKKAQNIISAFQKYFDSFSLDTSKFDKEFSLWETTDGLNATPAERNAKRIETVNNKIVKAVESTKFANYEYLEMVDQFGKESKQARESYNRYLDRQMEEAKLRIEAASLISEAVDAEREAVENQNGVLDSYIDYRNSLDSNEIDDTIRDNANLADLNKQLEDLKPLEQSTFKAWEDLKKLAEEGKVSAETVLAAKTVYLDICKQIEDKEDEIADTHRSIADRKHEEIAALKESREKDAEIWEQMYGENATDEERDSYYLNKLKQDENDAYNDMLIEQAEFERIKSEYAKGTAEYIAAENRYKQAVIDSNNSKQATRDYQKSAAERERDQLIELNELASSNADLEYRLWEATNGREATGVEKKSMKLGFLAKQVVAQAEIVRIAQREWENAKADEKASKYNEYLNEQLALANLQSEILDIEEENVKREKLAKNEYEKYIDKYEKYYLMNGMTRADLERDAKLISGYDPTAKTEAMVSKTTEKLSSESVLTNFSNIGTSYTTAVTEGIQNGVSTVVDSAATMVKSCVDILKEEEVHWKEVGASLVEGFIDGIESKAQEAIDAATQIAESTRNAIESILNSSLDYEPTIKPILDMSNVADGLGALNSAWSTSASLGLAQSASRSVDHSDVSVSTSGKGTTTYTFTQNNYSPKALSSVEIYRQTKNQLSTLKGMVNA